MRTIENTRIVGYYKNLLANQINSGGTSLEILPQDEIQIKDHVGMTNEKYEVIVNRAKSILIGQATALELVSTLNRVGR